MKGLIFYITVLSSLTTISASAQRTVTGRLVDKETGKPVKDASITQIGTDIKTTSNALGYFQLQIDSTVSIEIVSSDYPAMQVKLPEGNSFKIELTRPPVTNKSVEEVIAVSEEAGQNPEQIFLDEYGFPSSENVGKTYKIIVSHPIERHKFLITEYYLNDVKKETGTYLDKEGYTHDGFYDIFYTNGQEKESGFYDKGNRIGSWKCWYENGQLKEVGTYEVYKDYKVDNSWDSLGHPLVINGVGRHLIYDDETGIYEKGLIENGLKVGNWKGYISEDRLAYEEEFKKGQLTKGISYDLQGKSYPYKEIDETDLMSFQKFAIHQFKYPPEAKRLGVEGIVWVQALFDPSGKVLKYRLIKGIDSGCDEHV